MGGKMTNYEKIKNMTIEQLAKYLSVLNGGGIVREKEFLDYLKSEHKSIFIDTCREG